MHAYIYIIHHIRRYIFSHLEKGIVGQNVVKFELLDVSQRPSQRESKKKAELLSTCKDLVSTYIKRS